MSSPKDDPSMDIPDSTTGLTPRERQIVVDMWDIVKPRAKEIGVELFNRFFEEHPDYQQRFSSFRGIALSELRISKKLAAHATNVMYSLTCAIDNLEDPLCLKELLLKLGKNHGRHKVTEKEFHDLALVVMQLLKDKLGDELTSEAEEAWKKALDHIYKDIFEGLRAYDASQ